MIGADTYSEKSEITHPNHMFDSLGEIPRQRFTNTAAEAFTWCHVERLNFFFFRSATGESDSLSCLVFCARALNRLTN